MPNTACIFRVGKHHTANKSFRFPSVPDCIDILRQLTGREGQYLRSVDLAKLAGYQLQSVNAQDSIDLKFVGMCVYVCVRIHF